MSGKNKNAKTGSVAQVRSAGRLYVTADLCAAAEVALAKSQAHYLSAVLRMGEGAELSVFNGRDGEYRATLVGKKPACLHVGAQIRPQDSPPDLWLLFAPIKHARQAFLVEKAVELGVSRLLPVLTRRTAVARVNIERMEANAVEAAEQCGRLNVPLVREPQKLESVIAAWPPSRRLVLCDESGTAEPLAGALAALSDDSGGVGVLTGPEGGFEAEELEFLRKQPFVTPVSLGPRILRADTAALAALAVFQAIRGDWMP